MGVFIVLLGIVVVVMWMGNSGTAKKEKPQAISQAPVPKAQVYKDRIEQENRIARRNVGSKALLFGAGALTGATLFHHHHDSAEAHASQSQQITNNSHYAGYYYGNYHGQDDSHNYDGYEDDNYGDENDLDNLDNTEWLDADNWEQDALDCDCDEYDMDSSEDWDSSADDFWEDEDS